MGAPIPDYARPSGRDAAAAPPPPPEPGLLDLSGASWRTSADESATVQVSRADSAYSDIVQAIVHRTGEDPADYMRGWGDYVLAQVNPFADDSNWDVDKVWRSIAQARKADPQAFAELGEDRAAFEQRLQSRDGRSQRDDELLARGRGFGATVATLAGGALPAMADVPNIASLAVGAGAGVSAARAIVIDGLANAGVELVQAPGTIERRARLGKDTTGEDIAMRVGSAFIGGAAFRGAFELPGAIGRTVDANWAKLPDPLKQHWAAHRLNQGEAEPSPALLADTYEAIIGPDRLSDTEASAVIALRREGQMAEANPFARDGAGVSMHQQLAGTALARVLASPLPVEPRLVPVPSAPRSPVAQAMPAAEVRGGAAKGVEGGFMQRVRRQESGGNDAARNPRSSAEGRYQFIDDTWLAYYKRRFGGGGLSDAQIIAKKGDGRLQEILMRDLTADNAAVLRRASLPVTQGNLYLAHFAGPAKARRILEADPATPAEKLFSAAALEANPFLRGKTAADVVAWAHRAMGQAPIPSGARVRVGEGIDGAMARNEAERATIQDALDDATARAATLRAEERAARAEQDDNPFDERPGPLAWDDADLAEVGPLEPRAASEVPEVAALLPQLRAIESDRGRSLNAIDAIARELGASAEEVRAGLNQLAGEGRITLNRKTGNFMRKPPKGDDNELLNFLAKNGGLRDDEGHALGLRGLSASERRELVSGARRNVLRKRAASGKRDWNTMTRWGPLLRHEGRSVDDMGELLWEAGWFPARPTEAEVLDLIEQRISSNEPMLPPGYERPAEGEATGLGEGPDSFGQYVLPQMRDQWASERGNVAELDDWLQDDPDFINRTAEWWWINGGDIDNALERATLDAYDETAAALARETDDEAYLQSFNDAFDNRGTAPEGGGNDPWGAGPAGERGDAGAGGGDGAAADQARRQGERLAALPAEERSPFLDPDSPATRAQAESLEHDARARLEHLQRLEEAAPYGKEREIRIVGPNGARRLAGFEGARRVVLEELRKAGRYDEFYDTVMGADLERWARFGPVEVRVGQPEALDLADTMPWDAATKFVRERDPKIAGDAALRPTDPAFYPDGKLPPAPATKAVTPALDRGAEADPNARAVARQENDLRAQQPLRGDRKTGRAQDPTLPEGLFGGEIEPGFRFDEDGPERSLGDMLGDIDAEAADLKAIRDCLK